MTMAWLSEINFWHWWILAAVLGVLEMLAPGVLFLWLAIAAGVVGALLLAVPGLGWEVQVLIFAVLGVVSAVVGRIYFKHDEKPTDHPTLNQRAQQYIGEVFILETPMRDGRAKVRVGDGLWSVKGVQDMPKGARVRVVGVSATILVVEPVEDR